MICFAEITFTGEKVWGEIKEIYPTIGLGGTIYTKAFFPFGSYKLRYKAYLYFNEIVIL